MRQRHYVIFIPGLGDNTVGLKIITNHWRRFDLTPIVFSLNWRDKKPFPPKLTSLIQLVDKLSQQKCLVSLVGTSAGGSAALNAFIKRKNKINKVVNICGRLRTGSTTGFRSFALKTSTSPAFAESIKLLENQILRLTKSNRKKLMTIRPLFDELVPSDTVSIEDVHNIIIPTIEHSLSIALSLTWFSNKIVKFLNEG